MSWAWGEQENRAGRRVVDATMRVVRRLGWGGQVYSLLGWKVKKQNGESPPGRVPTGPPLPLDHLSRIALPGGACLVKQATRAHRWGERFALVACIIEQ